MKYRKKPVVIDAVQWDGTNHEDVLYLTDFDITINESSHECKIDTLEGVMTAQIGDYIIKGVQGEFYPCKPDIFNMTYERVEV